MNITIEKETEIRKYPVFSKILEDITGGVTLDRSDLSDNIEEIKAGAIIGEDLSTAGLYHICKSAKVQATVNAGATTIRVEKGHLFKIGDFITNGQVSTAITGISTSNANYDELTITATLNPINQIATGAVLYQGSSETVAGATPATATVEDAVDDTLTVTSPRGVGNGIKIAIAQAAGDTLAVSYDMSTNTISIDLANSTASNNTAANIQAAIRALGNYEGIDFTDWECSAGGSWDSATTGGTLTIAEAYMTGGIEAGADIEPKYIPEAILGTDVDVTKANPVGSAIVRGTVIENLMPYPVAEIHKENLKFVRFA